MEWEERPAMAEVECAHITTLRSPDLQGLECHRDELSDDSPIQEPCNV